MIRFRMAIILIPTLLIVVSASLRGASQQDWRSLSRESAGISPLPENEPRAVVQVLAARTYGWRGVFAVHAWISFKEAGAKSYTVTQVLGWRASHDQSVIVTKQDTPDRLWYGSHPTLIDDLRGAKAEKAIPKIQQAILSYPHPNEYQIWPGPNSNSFIAHLIREVPELEIELPPHAIGKDWIYDGKIYGPSQTGTGHQFSLFGVFGLTIGLKDGIEVNLLGLVFGLEFLRPALKLPFWGRIGLKDT